MSPFPKKSQSRWSPKSGLPSTSLPRAHTACPPSRPQHPGSREELKGAWPSEAARCETGDGAGLGPHKRSGGTSEPLAGERSGSQELMLEEG